jgi:hypothetical protein
MEVGRGSGEEGQIRENSVQLFLLADARESKGANLLAKEQAMHYEL